MSTPGDTPKFDHIPHVRALRTAAIHTVRIERLGSPRINGRTPGDTLHLLIPDDAPAPLIAEFRTAVELITGRALDLSHTRPAPYMRATLRRWARA